MRILALDIGDKWTGIAISDPSCIIARPLTTVDSADLFDELKKIITAEKITHIITGYPQTLRGTESEQTKKVLAIAKTIEETFPSVTCSLLDERLSSKEAARLKKAITKEEKLKQHAIAAAILLKSFLDFKQFEKETD